MIELKEAIERAKQFLVELNGDLERFQIEEITLSDDKKKWLVTTSFFRKIQSPNELQKTLGLESERVYKRVVIDSESDDVLGMMNWSFEKRETV